MRDFRSILPDLLVLELAIIEELSSDDQKNLIALLKSMKKLRALYINNLGLLLDATIYDDIFVACEQLQHFMHFSSQNGYVIMNKPSSRLIIANSEAFDMKMPAGIDTLDIIIQGMKGMGEFIDNYAKKMYFPAKYILISDHPRYNKSHTSDIITKFFGQCVPDWAKAITLQEISVRVPGIAVKISRPKDLTALKEIRVTIDDAEYIPTAWNCPDGYYFTVIYASRFSNNNGEVGISRMAPASKIRAIHFKCQKTLKRFFIELSKLPETANGFMGLVSVTGLGGAEVDMLRIPFHILNRFPSFESLFFKAPNQPVSFSHVEASVCRQAFGKHVPAGSNELCYYRPKSKMN